MIKTEAHNVMYDISGMKLQSRNNLLFAAGTVCVIAGLLFPVSSQLLDLLIIFTLCLTAAVIFVAFSTRRSSELGGFPLLVVLTICTQITSSIGALKILISDVPAPFTIEAISKINLIIYEITKGSFSIVLSVLAVVIFLAGWKISKTMLKNSFDFFDNAFAAKAAQNSGFTRYSVIVSDDENHNSKINVYMNFFLASSVTAKFIFCCSLILMIISFAGIPAAMITSSISRGGFNPVLSSGICMQFLALLVTISSAYLLKKSGIAAIEDTAITEEQLKQRIQVVAREIDSSNDSDDSIQSQLEAQPERSLNISAIEKSDLWNAGQIESEHNYQAVTELIINTNSKTILMAAACTEHLPVTIPVNIAIQLAQKSLKVLLIDCDLGRQSVLKVFEIGDKISAHTASGVENLWVGIPDSLNNKNNKQADNFDYTIIYAPKIRDLAKVKYLIRLSQSAMFFGSTHSEKQHADMTVLRKVLNDLNCITLEPAEIFSSV
ncbi:MAG: hypothetical protein WCZ89_00280 [Phycisphaerae bacterium]